MKWIGQQIYDLVSRFRDDVYLEDLSTTTETNVLVVDSLGKVSKNTSVSGDITAVIFSTDDENEISDAAGIADFAIAGGQGITTSSSSKTITITADAAQTGITSLGTLTALIVDNIGINGDTITASGDMALVATGNDISVDTDNFVITSSTAQKPFLELKNTTNDNKGSILQFTKDKGAAGADNDFVGIIDFMGDDAAQTQMRFAQITAQISEADNTDEAGKLTFSVAESDGTTTTLTAGLVIEGEHATDGKVDVTIAAGAASVTTVAGILVMGGTIAMTNAGLLAVANQSAVTGLGTISSGVWQGTTIKTAYIGDDQVTEDKLANTLLAEIDANTAKATNVTTNLTATTHASQITINSSDGTNVIVAEASGSIAGVMSTEHHDKLDAIEASATADQSKSDIDGLAITTVGTLDTGNATAVVDAASASAAGKVELATTGEADTGTDTARAVTPAGLKSHVDANARKCILRHQSFYVNDNPMVQNSLYFGSSIGHQLGNWNDPQAAGGVIGDTTSFTIAKGDENWGMVLPFDISKVEVQCSLQPQLGTGDDFTVAIYTGIRPNDSASALTLTLAAHQSIAFSSGSNRTMINDVSLTADLAKNTMIYVGVGSEDNTDAKNGRGYLTVTVTER